MTDKKFFILDGYGQIYRSYYAFMQNPLKDKQGNNVSAVFGFFNTIITLIKHYKPDYFAVAMDSKGKTFRHEMYPLYKANRAKTPEDLHAQIPVITQIMDTIGMKHYSFEGMEADDIIATVSKDATEMGLQTVMVTGDKDLLQLVNETVLALRPPRKGEHDYRLCGRDEVKELFGVYPDQIVDYLTILGDASDNVPGINGIGEKGAVSLLTEKETLDNAYEQIDTLKNAVKTKLLAAKDTIGLSRTLIQLKDDLFDAQAMDIAHANTSAINWAEAMAQFEKLGSQKLVSAARALAPKAAPAHKTPEADDAPALFEEQKEEQPKEPVASSVAVDLNLNTDDPAGLIGFDLKDKIRALLQKGVKAKAAFDLGIARWMLDSESGRYSEKDLCDIYLGSDIEGNEAVCRLYPILKKELQDKGLLELFTTMEMPLVSVLASMEEAGILLDPKRLEDFETAMRKECDETQQGVYTLCGHPFNLNSSKQLQEVLFVERELPTGKKTSSGFSTDSDVLEDLAAKTDDPVPALLLRYRALSKLLSVYTQPLIDIADQNGRIHTTFLQTGTATGRLSSKNPNLQNIPVRTEEGRKIRNAFVPANGCRLLSADYSQIELAVMAHISQDPELMKSFIDGEDVHRKTASLIFDVFPDLVTADQRRIAKTINFGVIYGMSAFRLANDLKIPRKDANNFINTYFERYKGVASFIERTKKEASQSLSVATMMGHIRAVPEIGSSNVHVRQAAERVAVNTVIQGTAAEIVKLAMIRISRALEEQSLTARLLLQVHDEVILEVPESEVEQVKNLVKDAMENAVKLSVPLRVSIEDAVCWGDMH